MKTIRVISRVAAAALMMMGVAATAQAQSQTVTISAPKFAVLALGAGVSLTTATPVAGSDVAAVSAATTWSATTNTTGAVVSSAISAGVLPTGMILTVAVGANSAVSLSSTAAAVATISKTVISGQAVNYTLTAHAADGNTAGGVALTVTYTIAQGT